MEAAQNLAPTTKTKPVASGDRTCLVTGETLPKSNLIRFVVGPDETIVPDLAAELPGRGLWVRADAETVATAAKKGLFAKAAKTAVKAAPDLVEHIVKLLRARCLNGIGMAKGAGVAILGQEQVGIALRAGRLALLLIADDAADAPNNPHQVPECRFFGRHELGQALGYEQIVYAGLKAHGLTARLQDELRRLSGFTSFFTLSQENR
jgi:predicted RNA-binding protein YlxR (DUF448 family)